MVEPLKDLLTNPLTDRHGKRDTHWRGRMAGELRHSRVELVADFVEIDARLGDVMDLRVGDVLPVELPEQVTACIDGVPVLECLYGSHHDRRALRVASIVDHSMNFFTAADAERPTPLSQSEEPDND